MSTDWENEDFRKLFEHPPPDFERLPFAARCLAAELVRRSDRRGRIVPGHRLDDRLVADLAFHVRAQAGEEAFIRGALASLLSDNQDPNECYLIFWDGYLTIRNFKKAQRSESAIRMAHKRNSDAQTSRDAPSGLVSLDQNQSSRFGSDGSAPSGPKDLSGSAREAGKKSPFRNDEERRWFEYWGLKLYRLIHADGVPRATEKRLGHFRARMRDGFSFAQFQRVVDAIAADEFMLGKNDRGRPYIEPENFMNNRERFETRLAQRAPARSGKSAPMQTTPAEYDPFAKGEAARKEAVNAGTQ